jgi:ubiquitin-conjugating enzyme E2 S
MSLSNFFDAKMVKRVIKELAELQMSPVEGIRVDLASESNVSEIGVELDGPQGTPYAGGMFRLRLALPPDYPCSPPKGWFLTKIFHPNVAPTSGEICVNVLKKDWAPETMGVRHVLVRLHWS